MQEEEAREGNSGPLNREVLMLSSGTAIGRRRGHWGEGRDG